MRLPVLLKLVLALATLCQAFSVSNHSSGAVTWDEYSLIVNGERVLINAAEFHYQRLPVPEMWLDVLQKLKANGFNTISVYFFWSYHSASRDAYDYETGAHNIQRLFDMAKQTGLWVIARPGAYVNAQTNAGGLALWGSDGSMGKLRTSDEAYHQAWLPYMRKVGQIIAASQITKGGPVILFQVENELRETSHKPNNTLVTYMEQLESGIRDVGITVPMTHNEQSTRYISWSRNYENVGGAVDIYGFDDYPAGFLVGNKCDGATGFDVVRTYYQRTLTWGAPQNYDDCRSEHSTTFVDIYYKNNIGQRVTLQSIYEGYGGTNWGHSACPVAYTSNDYMTPLRETREQWAKLWQTKLIQLFSGSAPDLLKTNMHGNGSGYSLSTPDAYSWVLKNPDTQATFTVLQQNETPSTATITFSAYLNTSLGNVTVPGIQLEGRQSKILVTDYKFGNQTLLYSSADVLTNGVLPHHDVLILYLWEGQTGEFALRTSKNLTFEVYGASTVSSTIHHGYQKIRYTQSTGSTVLRFSNGVIVLLLDQPTAWHIWAPPTSKYPSPKPDQKLFILGPYLVRFASVNNEVLQVSGDNNGTMTLESFIGDVPIKAIEWNGQLLTASKTPYGSYTAQIPGTENRSIFDDSRWTVANKNSTLSPIAPLTLPVLFSDYGYYAGAKIYRGYFDGIEHTAVNITASGGLAFGWNAWLNGHLIGGHASDPNLSATNLTLTLPVSHLKTRNNVITVLVDYHDHDETDIPNGAENPRGILGAYLLPGGTRTETGFRLWKIQGNAGGSKKIDPVRGPMNEGGLYAERLGWFLPGFPASDDKEFKSTSSPLDGLSRSGVRFYVTTFNLDIDSDLDAPIGVALSAPNGIIARVMLWVNGYQYGKYVPHIGPQTKFPIPPGIINNRGQNTLALSVWAQTDAGVKLDTVQLFTYGLYQTDFQFDRDWSYLQPRWEDRSMYS
ncbi:family 35 glycosyl hydrolase [Aspergillus costaricaensis CBS 115574]|uniref:Family 35 glycosyl hydrolase n=1 Tax=Aspergillus costaricaensis CBS 115574 TaxID=1448317 RepID=A0ACD1IIC1_9EURO|nr:family 35 glycosyl hydrolase [Aspergillus costaricaensis CBS 115574]RAK90054.1 family 35 glycosyl hydrolase [Aspergillus costaricaensis CBS 115574]